jgi:hypothetical protein
MTGEPGLAWVVLVTRGTTVAFPPELYREREYAIREAKRWAWTLAGEGWIPVTCPFTGRWEAGDYDVRLELLPLPEPLGAEEIWVCTHWSPEGSPEFHLVGDRSRAADWVRESPVDEYFESFTESAWQLVATFRSGDDESYSVAHLAKHPGSIELHFVEYEVELEVTFVHEVRGVVTGPPGLDREGIVELVERDFISLSANPDVLLESRWKLIGYRSVALG